MNSDAASQCASQFGARFWDTSLDTWCNVKTGNFTDWRPRIPIRGPDFSITYSQIWPQIAIRVRMPHPTSGPDFGIHSGIRGALSNRCNFIDWRPRIHPIPGPDLGIHFGIRGATSTKCNFTDWRPRIPTWDPIFG